MIQGPTELFDPVMAIGTLADRVGLSVSAVRKYEKEGLILAHRTASGHRLFSLEDVDRVRHIQKLIQEIGLNIEGIRHMQALLPCWKLLSCPEDRRKRCPMLQITTRPCWMVKGLECAPQGNECRRCPVYRFGSLVTDNVKQLLQENTDAKTLKESMRRFIEERKRTAPKKED